MNEISIIVAIADNYVIGNNNMLLWHIPGDLKRFKAITMGHPVVMGRKTYESLPKRPLPGRENIVITSNSNYDNQGITILDSTEKVFDYIKGKDEIFVIGGGNVYRQFLPFTNKLYLTRVHKFFEGDTFFPEINFLEWSLIEKEEHRDDGTLGFDFTYETYIKRQNL